MAIRFGRKTEENWKEMVLNKKAVLRNYKKRKGRIMFPTSHDITMESCTHSIIVLKKLLKAGNEVLITTKPNLICTAELLKQLEEFKDQIQFRFTITSVNDDLLTFWEPGASNFQERLQSLMFAKARGFKTSVSIESFLDENPVSLILRIFPDITESIWLGKMNYIQAKDLTDKEKKYYDYQREISSWSNINKIVDTLKLFPENIKSKIRIKDSIQNMYIKRGIEVKLK